MNEAHELWPFPGCPLPLAPCSSNITTCPQIRSSIFSHNFCQRFFTLQARSNNDCIFNQACHPCQNDLPQHPLQGNGLNYQCLNNILELKEKKQSPPPNPISSWSFHRYFEAHNKPSFLDLIDHEVI